MEMRKKIISGLSWKFAERILAQVVSTIVSIILARVLMPRDYGVVAIVLIFINLANVFVSTGFGQALVQDKDSDELDFSTLFYCSLFFSIVLYIVVFWGAILVAKIYKDPIYVPVLRVLGLKLILSGYNTIQQAYVQKKMLFKKFFWSTLIGTVISAIIGIYGAYSGWGIWALVAQYMINSLCDTLVLFFTVSWKPKLLFSKERALKLFSYSWKLTSAELVNTVYNELRSFLIGKVYTSADLGYYTKGEQIPKLISVNINSSIVSVLFPAISSVNNELMKVKSYTRKSVRVSSYIIIPAMTGLAVISPTLIPLLLTEKWNAAIPYMMIACICYASVPINSANLQAIKAIGRSDIYFSMETTKKVVGFIAMISVIKFGVFWIAFIRIPLLVFEITINILACKKHIGYSFREYLNDLKAPILISGVMAVSILTITPYLNSIMGKMAVLSIEIIIGIVLYLVISIGFKCETFKYIIKTINGLIKKNKD